MELTDIQRIALAFIIIPGVVLGIAVIVLKRDISRWLLRYGALLAVPGILLSVFSGKAVLDVLFLNTGLKVRASHQTMSLQNLTLTGQVFDDHVSK